MLILPGVSSRLFGAVFAATLIVTGCSNSSVQTPGQSGGPSVGVPGGMPGGGLPGAGLPGGSSGSPGEMGSGQVGQSGQASPAGPAGPAGKSGGTPDATTGSGGAGAAGSDDPQGAFDKSLGDFDGEIARERDAMASAGKGSGRSAETREAGDAAAVKKSGNGGRSGGGAGAEASTGRDNGSGDTDSDGPKATGSEPPTDETVDGGGEAKPNDKDTGPKNSASGEGKGPVAPIPDDIPKDGSADDAVAKQIREAAEAEQDPHVRDALWEEYRRVTGLSKK